VWKINYLFIGSRTYKHKHKIVYLEILITVTVQAITDVIKKQFHDAVIIFDLTIGTDCQSLDRQGYIFKQLI
jgi:hypothetical protein